MLGINLKRLEEQLYMYNPKLHEQAIELQSETLKRLETQILLTRGPIVNLQRWRENMENKPIMKKKIKDIEILEKKEEIFNAKELDVSDEESQPLSEVIKRQKMEQQKRERKETEQELESSVTFVSVNKANSADSSETLKCKRKDNKFECNKNVQINSWHQDTSNLGMSLCVQPSSHDTPLTVTLHVPAVMHQFEKAIKFDIQLESEALTQHLLNAKERRAAQEKKTVHQDSVPVSLHREEEELARLMSDVLVDSEEVLKSRQVVNALVKNNIRDNYNANCSLETRTKKETDTSKIKEKRKNDKLKKSKETTKTNRHCKANSKSDLAKYVEQFANDCEQSGSVTPESLSTLSQQLVSSTTHNLESSTPNTYYFENGQIIPITNVTNVMNYSSQLMQDEIIFNGPFDDFVKYIESSNADASSNVIERVLEGGATYSLLNDVPCNIKQSSKFDIPASGKPELVNYLSNNGFQSDSLPPQKSLTAASAYDALDLSFQSKKYDQNSTNSANVAKKSVNIDDDLPLDLSLKDMDVVKHNYNKTHSSDCHIVQDTESGELSFQQDINMNNNIKTTLDMPLLDEENNKLLLTMNQPKMLYNQSSFEVDFANMVNNLEDERMEVSTTASTKSRKIFQVQQSDDISTDTMKNDSNNNINNDFHSNKITSDEVDSSFQDNLNRNTDNFDCKSLLDLEAVLNSSFLDFNDDTLSLVASSIGSSDEIEPETKPMQNKRIKVNDKRKLNTTNALESNLFVDTHTMKQITDATQNFNVSLLPPTESKELENATGVILPWCDSKIPLIFGVTCWSYLGNECVANTLCSFSHKLREPELVNCDLESLSNSQLNMSYNFVYNHTTLYRHYFATYCYIYASRKNRVKLLQLVNDCERHLDCPQFLQVIFCNLLLCGLNKVNACRLIISRSRIKSASFLGVLVNIIMEADWTMFCDHLERFAESNIYKFGLSELDLMAQTVLHSKDVRLAKTLFVCLLAMNPTEIDYVQNSWELTQCLELIKKDTVV